MVLVRSVLCLLAGSQNSAAREIAKAPIQALIADSQLNDTGWLAIINVNHHDGTSNYSTIQDDCDPDRR